MVDISLKSSRSRAAQPTGCRARKRMLLCWSRARLQGLPLAGLLGTVKGFASETLVDYQRQIQPLLDRFCVACHACYAAPCQLDLTHAAGAARGTSKQPDYDAARLDPAPPTRLFIDAGNTAAWRELSFFPVTQGQEASPPYFCASCV